MAIRCPNCERGLGLRLMPPVSTTWHCWCGVTVYHSLASFLEAWVRSLVLISITAGAITAAVLAFSGLVATTSLGNLALLGLGAGAILAVCLLPIDVPVALLVAYRKGIPFSASAKIYAIICIIILLAGCPYLAWLVFDAIRERFFGG
jgi:hypothetical protein